jgi:hypothetical protein
MWRSVMTRSFELASKRAHSGGELGLVALTVFKTVRELDKPALVGSIPTHLRHAFSFDDRPGERLCRRAHYVFRCTTRL